MVVDSVYKQHSLNESSIISQLFTDDKGAESQFAVRVARDWAPLTNKHASYKFHPPGLTNRYRLRCGTFSLPQPNLAYQLLLV